MTKQIFKIWLTIFSIGLIVLNIFSIATQNGNVNAEVFTIVMSFINIIALVMVTRKNK